MKNLAAVALWVLAMTLMYAHPGISVAQEELHAQEMQYITEFSYHAGPKDSRQTALALALYGAKHKAVVLSAQQLAEKGLLSDFGDMQMAVFCLVADEMRSSIIEEVYSVENNTSTVKIKSSASLKDFVKAGIQNEALNKKENHLSLREELDPVVSAKLDPALELSRVYRYLARDHWRMAVIYLDRLEEKYPYWGALYLARAAVYQGMHETEKMREALVTACNFGNHEACKQLANSQNMQ